MRRIVAAITLLAAACTPTLRLTRDDSATVLAGHTIEAPDPAARGTLPVRTLYYGSGTDRNRAEYRDSVTIRTDSVDASKLVDLGTNAKSRNGYWGFSPKGMPLNARVWYPEGNGPFPLVLIVHGNHDMKDFSDPGYGYLGELLASRGYIFASVDMNFINGGISGENDARGWFLLKHVEAFRRFNETEGNPFRGKVDLQRIALIGHSRGGEAVGHAAAFNRMKHYPDDATFAFDFNYNIRGVIAIAPVDAQYRPSDRLVPVQNVDYLVFHGSHDGDVSSFTGLRQYQRVAFTEPGHFKSAVYVYRANHGQWNTVWGNRDNGERSARILDLRGLMPPEDQRKFAEVYISSFLETSLRGDQRYLPLFRDHRVAGNWLPKTMYVTRYQDSSFRPAATFEEDADVTTGSIPGITLSSDSLGSWREGGMNLRNAGTNNMVPTLDNFAVWVGWNNRIQGERDTTKLATPAAFTVSIDGNARRTLGIDARSVLEFQLLPVDGQPAARKTARDSTARADSAARRAPTPPRRNNENEEKPPVDLSIEVTDANGIKVSVPLSKYGTVRRPLEMNILRRADRERTQFARMYEMVLQTYSIPLAELRALEPRFDPARLATVRFLFDRAPMGTAIIDDIGFARR
jgi:dienelactone hydrolase